MCIFAAEKLEESNYNFAHIIITIRLKKMRKMKILAVAFAGLMAMGCGSMGQALGSVSKGNGIVDAITSVIGLDKVTAKNLVGTWKYNSPGCAFTSENLLAKAGGEVAAAQIEEKLLPYYQQVGLSSTNTYIAFNEDGTFTSKIAGTTFNGKYTFDEATQQVKLQGLLLSINCYTKKATGGISILFEAKKLLTLLQTMSKLSGNANLQTIGELSQNYDGVRIGFDMKK